MLLICLYHLTAAAALGWLGGLVTSPEVRAGSRRVAEWRGAAAVLLAGNVLVLLVGAAAAAGGRLPRVLESPEGVLGLLTVLVFAWGFGTYEPARAVRIGAWVASGRRHRRRPLRRALRLPGGHPEYDFGARRVAVARRARRFAALCLARRA